MAKTVGKLTTIKIARELPKGKHADGAGLYLHVSASGAKSWVYRYSIAGQTREMGLGSLSVLSLAEARAKRDEHRKTLKLDRQDPLKLRKAQHARVALEQAKAITFKEAAE